MTKRMERIDKNSRRIGPGLFYKTCQHPTIPGEWLTTFYQRIKGGRAMLYHRHREQGLSESVMEEFRKWGQFRRESAEGELRNSTIIAYGEFCEYREKES